MHRAGLIVWDALEQMRAMVKPGISTKELDEFAEGVELPCEKLPRAYNAERLVAVSLLNVAEALDHRVECLVPGDWCENTVLAQERLFSAARC